MQYNHMRKSFPRVSYIVRAASQGLSRCPPLLKLVSRGYFTVLKDAHHAHSSHRSVGISQCSQMQSWSPTDTQLDSMDRALGSPTAEMGQNRWVTTTQGTSGTCDCGSFWQTLYWNHHHHYLHCSQMEKGLKFSKRDPLLSERGTLTRRKRAQEETQKNCSIFGLEKIRFLSFLIITIGQH